MVPYQPVVEVPHEGAFLTTLPRNVDVPHGFQLPIMIGATSEEGLLKTAPLLNVPLLLDDYIDKFEQILPIQLQYDHHPKEVVAQITRDIEKFYLKNGHTYNKENHQNLTDVSIHTCFAYYIKTLNVFLTSLDSSSQMVGL